MVSDEMIVKEFVRLPKKEIDSLVRTILLADRNLPSKSQLHRFRNIVLSRGLDGIEEFLKQRVEVAGSEEWWRRSFDNRGLADILLQYVTGPVGKREKLDPDTDLWGAESYRLFKGARGPVKLTDQFRDFIARETLVGIVDILLMHMEDSRMSAAVLSEYD